jgi:hypothetical protein
MSWTIVLKKGKHGIKAKSLHYRSFLILDYVGIKYILIMFVNRYRLNAIWL